MKELVNVPEGRYRCRKWYQLWKRGGWLSVDHEADGSVSIMWTSHRDVHLPLFRHATVVDVDKNGKLTAYYESVISMWMKWGYGRGTKEEYQVALTEARWMATILCPQVRSVPGEPNDASNHPEGPRVQGN